MKRIVLVLMAVLLFATACTSMTPRADQSDQWRVLKTGTITRAPAELPQEGVHLFQSLAELQTWTERYQIDVPTEGVDFSEHTVAVLIRHWSGFQPVVKKIDMLETQLLKAVVVLSEDRSKPLPQPGLPAGLEIRQFVAVQLFKVSEVTVQEE